MHVAEGTREESTLPIVLVVDDDESHRTLVMRWLERGGYEAHGFADGASCIEALERVIPDAVLLDLHMSGIGGMTVLGRLRHTHPFLPVLMLTADAGVPHAVKAIQAGACDYLTKPVDRMRLIEAVKGAVDQNLVSQRMRQADRDQRGAYGGIVGVSPPMLRLFRQIDRVAASDVTVLITGESGTGKELVARAIHMHSGRAGGPFVAINCAAIPETLQETELFGHEKGAFTGAGARRTGRFEQANRGTLFLDEVGELSPGLQAKLLRVLQERQFYRVGGNEEIDVDVRIVTATYKDLVGACQKGEFREDLFYRLAVFEFDLAPLRERREDIPLLAAHFLAEAGARGERPRVRFSDQARQALLTYAWPGNVRELQNAVERALVASSGDVVELEDLPRRVREMSGAVSALPPTVALPPMRVAAPMRQPLAPPSTLDVDLPPRDQVERDMILDAIRRAEGNMSEVIRALRIPRTTLYRKLKKYQIEP